MSLIVLQRGRWGGHKYSWQSPIYSHLGPRGNRGGRIHMYDGRVRYCDASWQRHRRSDELSRFTCQRSGTTADLDSLLYQTQGGTHEPSESVKWRRDSLQALSHAGIGSLERRGKKEGVQIKRQRCFFFLPSCRCRRRKAGLKLILQCERKKYI